MKLSELFEFKAVPAVGPDVNRPTPVTFKQMVPPSEEEWCKDRSFCERKKKKKYKKRMKINGVVTRTTF